MKQSNFTKEGNFYKNGNTIQFAKIVILIVMMVMFTIQGFGQRIINGFETWASNGITTIGAPSTGPTPINSGGIYTTNFDIIIRPGAVLLFSGCMVLMGAGTQAIQQRSITVECGPFPGFPALGGMLLIREARVSRVGNTGLWAGISVLGRANLPQTWVPFNTPLGQMNFQGSVIIEQGSSLSYALDGIRTWDGLTAQNTISGGVILANGAWFTNNHRSIQFERYANGNNSNVSSITNCTFLWDDATVNLYCGISGWNVRAVPVDNCMFDYHFTATTFTPSLDHIGIDGWDFSFIATNNRFINNKIGIFNRSITGSLSMDVRGNRFTNNWKGVYSKGIPTPTITNNNVSGLVNQLNAHGISIETGSGYNISNNSLFDGIPTTNKTGINIKNSGTAFNLCRNNDFTAFLVCSQSEGRNRNAIDPELGLKFLCNIYMKYIVGISLINDPQLPVLNLTGASREQGRTIAQRNAKNQFQRSGPCNPFTDIKNNTNSIDYFYCCSPLSLNFPEHPFCTIGPVVPVSHPWPLQCPVPQLFKTTLSYPEDAEEIYYWIQHYSVNPLQTKDSLYYFVNLWGSPYGKLLKSDLLMEDSAYATANDVYNEIAADPNLDPDEAEEFTIYGRRLLDIRLTMAADGREINELNESEVTNLEGIADSAITWAKVRAENWLNLYDGRSIPDIHGQIDIDTTGLYKYIDPNNSITLYPNPVQGQLDIDYVNMNEKGAEMEIVNVFGLLMNKTILEDKYGHKTLDVSNWSSGFYFYTVKYNDLVIEKGKFFKQ